MRKLEPEIVYGLSRLWWVENERFESRQMVIEDVYMGQAHEMPTCIVQVNIEVLDILICMLGKKVNMKSNIDRLRGVLEQCVQSLRSDGYSG